MCGIIYLFFETRDKTVELVHLVLVTLLPRLRSSIPHPISDNFDKPKKGTLYLNPMNTSMGYLFEGTP